MSDLIGSNTFTTVCKHGTDLRYGPCPLRCDTTVNRVPDPARYLDLDSPSAERRLAAELWRARDWLLLEPNPGHVTQNDLAHAILAALRNPTADEG